MSLSWTGTKHWVWAASTTINILYQIQSDSVESSCSVVWLWVKLVGAWMMENRCGNGLILLLDAAAAFPAVMKNNTFIPGGRWPHMTPSFSSSCPANLQWVCWQDSRWLGWVASGLCTLSVIKERKKVYGLLVIEPLTDGMSSKHPPIPNLLRDWGGVGVGNNLPFFSKQPTGLGIELDCAVQFDNLAIKQVIWVKFNRLLNIYDLICIMLMNKRLLRWMQIFIFWASLVGVFSGWVL